MSEYDVVVVGAGPAGSVAALVLARGGARVALADKAAFPRDKACGDLIGPRGVQVLADLGVTVPDAGHGSDLLAVGPAGRRPAPRPSPGAAIPVTGSWSPGWPSTTPCARPRSPPGPSASGRGSPPWSGARGGRAPVRAVLARRARLAGDVIIGADGALSPVARLAGMLDPDSALWGFAVRAYVPGEVPLPLLVLLESAPWRIYPGYGWLFPGADGQANVGIGVGMGGTRHSAPLRGDLDRFTTLLRSRGDLRPAAEVGPVIGGWLRMGGTGTPPAAGNVLLAGDAAGLINPLQGEGIAPAMISARLAAEAVLADPCQAGPAYTRALDGAFGRYLPGASALQRTLLRRPWAASASMRLVTAPVVGRLVASTWSIYWNGLTDGAAPSRPHGPPAPGAATRLAGRTQARAPRGTRDARPGGREDRAIAALSRRE